MTGSARYRRALPHAPRAERSACRALSAPVGLPRPCGCLGPVGLWGGEAGQLTCARKQSRNDQAAIKEHLDQEWRKKMRRKRDHEMGKSLRQAAKTGDVEAHIFKNTLYTPLS